MDERDELLREIDRVLAWATRHNHGALIEETRITVSQARAPEAVRKIFMAMVKAKTLRGVRW